MPQAREDRRKGIRIIEINILPKILDNRFDSLSHCIVYLECVSALCSSSTGSSSSQSSTVSLSLPLQCGSTGACEGHMIARVHCTCIFL